MQLTGGESNCMHMSTPKVNTFNNFRNIPGMKFNFFYVQKNWLFKKHSLLWVMQTESDE